MVFRRKKDNRTYVSILDPKAPILEVPKGKSKSTPIADAVVAEVEAKPKAAKSTKKAGNLEGKLDAIINDETILSDLFIFFNFSGFKSSEVIF